MKLIIGPSAAVTFIMWSSFLPVANAAVTLIAGYHLGEDGQHGTFGRPLDYSGNGHHFNNNTGTLPVPVTGSGAIPGSTGYLDGTGTTGGFYSTLGTAVTTNTDWAINVRARVPNFPAGTTGSRDIFQGNGHNSASAKLTFNQTSDTAGNWVASLHNTTFVGGGGGIAVAEGEWAQLTLIRLGDQVNFYVNGTQVGNTIETTNTNNNINTPQFHLGVHSGGGAGFTGHTDELTIWDLTGETNFATVLASIPEPTSVPPVEPVGASGTWVSTVDGNWSLNSNWDAGVIATSSNNTATFSAGSGPIAVTLDSSRSIGNLAFSNADYTIGGTSVLTLNSTVTPVVSVATGRIATLATNVAGSLGLQKTGPGTLTLTGPNNSYTGTTTISDGILQIGGGGRLGSGTYTNAISIASGATLQYSSSAAQTLSGAITGDGGITKDTNNSDLTVSNTGNIYTGITAVSQGRIVVGAATHLSSGATSIVQSGTGQIYSTSTATLSNPSSISTIGFNEGDARGTTIGAIRLSGGTLSGDVTLLGNSRIGGFLRTAGTQINTISGKITGGFGIDFYGAQNAANAAQVIVLTNTGNDYTGDTTILNGTFQNAVNLAGVSTTLRLGASGVIPDGASAGNVVFALPHVDNDNATLGLDLFGSNETINGLTVAPGTFNTRITNTAAAADSVLTIGANNTTSSFSGTVTDSGVGRTLAITKIGTGTLTLSGINSYRGDTTVSDGTLTLDNPNTSNETSTVTIATTAVLNLNFSGTDTVRELVIGNIPKGVGEYGNSSSVFPVIPLSQITGSGTITVSLGGYSAWQSANSTSQTIDLDHDSDGVPNGVEFFLGGTTDTTGFTALPSVIDTAGVLSVTWTKAATYTGTYGTDFVVETSATLASGSWVNETLGGTVTLPTANEVKYTFPAGTTNFVRLKVTGP